MKINPAPFIRLFSALVVAVALQACNNAPSKKDYVDNTPTAGKLKVWYDDALELHVKNQSETFESQYPNVQIDLFPSSENEAVQALYSDKCEAIVISRQLNAEEKKAFESKTLFPKFTAVAKSGIALITNINTPLSSISYSDIIRLLTSTPTLKDTLGNDLSLKVLLDKNNSSVVHYLKDSILQNKTFSSNCNILNSSIEAINYVAQNKNTIAFVDFAWLSDTDDSLYIANSDKIKFLHANVYGTNLYEVPGQSSFKTGTYPFTRTIYVYRKTGDFTLAKGFEAFVAGPKGQLTFLKQGLLPTRQAERNIHVNMEAIKEE
jgi:phosphate transport system substrate-binding protein